MSQRPQWSQTGVCCGLPPTESVSLPVQRFRGSYLLIDMFFSLLSAISLAPALRSLRVACSFLRLLTSMAVDGALPQTHLRGFQDGTMGDEGGLRDVGGVCVIEATVGVLQGERRGAMYASRRRSHSIPERRCGLGAPLRGHLSVRARAPHVRRGNGQTIVHLRVCQHILRGRALLGIDGQQLPDEVLGRRRDVVPPRRREVIPARGEGRGEERK